MSNAATGAGAPLEVIEEELRWKFRHQGRLLLAYNRCHVKWGDFYKSKPDWYPVLTPSGREVTISSAFRYNHHHSIWIGHGNVNGVNVFHDNNPTRPNLGDIVLERAELRVEPRGATLDTTNGWIAKDGRRLLTEVRRFTVRPDLLNGQAHALDVDSEIIASEGPVLLARETHSYLGVRVADSIDVEDGGRAVNSNGDENEEGAMGKAASWLDYSRSGCRPGGRNHDHAASRQSRHAILLPQLRHHAQQPHLACTLVDSFRRAAAPTLAYPDPRR